MIGLTLIAALTGTHWEPVDLQTFRAPASFFVCGVEPKGKGLFTLFLRHNPTISEFEVAHFTGGDERMRIQTVIKEASFRELTDDAAELQLLAESKADQVTIVATIDTAKGTGTLEWTEGPTKITAQCTSAMVPPGRED